MVDGEPLASERFALTDQQPLEDLLGPRQPPAGADLGQADALERPSIPPDEDELGWVALELDSHPSRLPLVDCDGSAADRG